jgi:TPR repeat protein
MYRKLVAFLLLGSVFSHSASAMVQEEATTEDGTQKKTSVQASSVFSGRNSPSPDTVQYRFSLSSLAQDLPITSSTTHPWKGVVPVSVSIDVLEDFFQNPSPSNGQLLKARLKSLTPDSAIEFLKETKKKIGEITDVSKIRALQMPLEEVFNTLTETLDSSALLLHLPYISQEVLDVRPGHLTSTLLGYVFFPKEFSDGHTSFASSAMNLPMHWKLAVAARAGYPAAQYALANIFEDDLPGRAQEIAQQLRAQAKKITQEIAENPDVPPYYKGLAWKQLWISEDDDLERKSIFLNQEKASFENSLTEFPGPAHYTLANIAGLLGTKGDSLAHYQQSSDAGYAPAFFRLGRLSSKADDAFKNYKEAGKLGIGEAYFEIAKMVEQGRALPLTEKDPSTYEGWLSLSANSGSVIAIGSLARFYHQQDNIHQELLVWERKAMLGYASGFLKKGQILENCGQFQEALALYRHPNAGSYGLYDFVRKFGPNPDLLKEAETKDKEDYTTLLTFFTTLS